MRMVFTREELDQIVRNHLVEKLGVDAASIADPCYFTQIVDGHTKLAEVSVDITTDGAVPMGASGQPYR